MPRSKFSTTWSAGAPIKGERSFAMPTWMLADSYFPAEFKNWLPLLYWFMGAVMAAMLFVSV